MKGETAFIDPRYRQRSKEEAKLVEIIEKCFLFEPEKRISIFDIVRMLEDAIDECIGREASIEEVLKEVVLLPSSEGEDSESDDDDDDGDEKKEAAGDGMKNDGEKEEITSIEERSPPHWED